ncbi:MAG TPA: hypothetical protein VLC10_05370 [Patescibacteria group bacterium]|nr:hypothetical protein [Patescibacteria group bacterium]
MKGAAKDGVSASGVSRWADGLIGNGNVAEFLDRAVRTDRLAHAYLFVGPDRVGKATAARRFAASLLGVENPGTHPDFCVVERETDPKTGKPHAGIVLDQVHALTGRLALGAMMNGWKACVLDGADLLNKESANALLKTLEEPHPKTVLLLTADDAERVMATIRSRCQVVRFSRVPAAAIAAGLVRRGIEPARADLFARLAGGRPGAAIAYAEDPAALDGMFALRAAILAMPSSAVADRFAAVEKAVPPKLPFQEAVDRSRAWLDLAAELLRDAMLLRLGSSDRIMHVDVREQLESWAAAMDPAAALAALGESRALVDANVSPRAALERLALVF